MKTMKKYNEFNLNEELQLSQLQDDVENFLDKLYTNMDFFPDF